MQTGIRQVQAETVERFRAACGNGAYARNALAQELCGKENRRNRPGSFCLGSARGLLPELTERLKVGLPEATAFRTPLRRMSPQGLPRCARFRNPAPRHLDR